LERQVRIVEVGPRDGLQNHPEVFPTETKRRFVEALFAAGLRDVEVTSFVRPDLVPQLADAAELFPLVRRPPGDAARALVLVANRRGLERAMEAGADAISLIAAVTDGFSRANTGRSAAEGMATLRALAEEARPRVSWLRGYVSTCFRCPYDGPVSSDRALATLEEVAATGVDEVVVSDTLGDATPDQVEAICNPLLEKLGPARVALHLHDTAGRALACAEHALRLGVRSLDGSVAGLGGCPFAPGAKGNVATEAIVRLCEELELATGVDVAKLRNAAELLDRQSGAA
jgi:isopropylmalate/homocitrate/citramalate synthase